MVLITKSSVVAEKRFGENNLRIEKKSIKKLNIWEEDESKNVYEFKYYTTQMSGREH